MRTIYKVLSALAISVCCITAVQAKPVIHHAKSKHVKHEHYRPTDASVSGDLLHRAESLIGRTGPQLGLPRSLWCADFLNLIAPNGGTHSRLAFSYRSYGTKAEHGCVNCIVVLSRRGGGHVGVVKNYDNHGNPVVVSGNHGGRVAVGKYSKDRVVAYRWAPSIS